MTKSVALDIDGIICMKSLKKSVEVAAVGRIMEQLWPKQLQ